MTMKRTAFTLVELLVVIGIIAILVSILLPSLMRARVQSKNVQCQSQLRNLGQALVMYVNENRGKLPQHPSDALWLWDIPLATRDAMVRNGGSRKTLYCPFFFEQDVDELWEGTFGGSPHSYSVIGYFWLGRRLSATDPSAASPLYPNLNGRSYVQASKLPPPPSVFPQLAPKTTSEVEVAADEAVRQGTSWWATGGFGVRHATSHMRRNLPEGINILFLDWHVGFRPYKATPQAGDDVIRLRGKWGTPQIEFWF